jgi:transposase
VTDFLQMHPDGVILALDQLVLYFQATLTCVWSPIGQTPLIKVHPQRECRYFYGALNLCNGREVAMPALEQTSQTTANFVMILLMLYPQPILLLLDRAPWHAGALRQLLDETERLQILYFPVACPDLNPQEHVWDSAREAISHNHTHRSFETLLDEFETYLNETPFTTHFLEKYVPPALLGLCNV